MRLRMAATGIGLIGAAMLGGCTGATPHLPVNDPIMEAVFPGDPAMHPSPPGPFVNGKPYTVTIKTGDVEKAGTDANVYIAFEGTKDDSEDILLENPQRDNFERGHADDFHFDYRDVGKIKAIWLRQDNTGFDPGWYVEWVEVKDNVTGAVYHFDVHRWLASDQGDRLTKVYEKVK